MVTAGNHDSPSFLNAPRELLKYLNVHVVGCASDPPADEAIVLARSNREPGLIVCAIPYLRDRDIRVAEAGESIEDKERKLIEGIRTHYRLVCEAARQKRDLLNKAVPIVAMGHLFAAGGRTVDGDGVRELYIGSLAQVRADLFPEGIDYLAMGHLFAAGGRTVDGDGVRELYIGSLAQVRADLFPEGIDYLALGHLHIPQKVGGSDFIRYSGSPLPIGFGEADQQKCVVLVEFSGNAPHVTEIPVPRFRVLKTLRGDWQTIAGGIDAMTSKGGNAWLEIIYDGEEIIGNLRERLDEANKGTGMEILRIRNNQVLQNTLGRMGKEESLDDLDVTEVFKRCLDTHEVPEEQRPELLSAYREVIVSLNEADLMAD
ncbi:MAG: exonuclease sbcCD subunit D [Syntrophus sp. RIFOXYC2_FULL_54_9]|nr:MAG: exonuclease sbcCD subunit D [Syntrophus sp. RIFOXYC2_FULL_54_9]